MPELTIDGSELVVRMSAWERMAAMRGDIRVPLSAVTAVAIEPRPWSALRGIRSPGTGWPGVIAYGVRRLTGERPDFAAILRKRPVVRVELDPPSAFAQLLISVSDGERAVELVRAAAGLRS